MKGKKRFLDLSSSQRLALESGHKNGKKATFRQRCHYILLSDQGKTLEEIADFYQTTRQTLGKWFTRYELDGIDGLQTAKGNGRPAIIRIDNEAEVTKIEKWVEESPQNLNKVLGKIAQELGKEMSKRTLQRLLEKKMAVETLSERNTRKTKSSRDPKKS